MTQNANLEHHRALNVRQNMGYATSSPSATSGGGQNNSPVCHKIPQLSILSISVPFSSWP